MAYVLKFPRGSSEPQIFHIRRATTYVLQLTSKTIPPPLPNHSGLVSVGGMGSPGFHEARKTKKINDISLNRKEIRKRVRSAMRIKY